MPASSVFFTRPQRILAEAYLRRDARVARDRSDPSLATLVRTGLDETNDPEYLALKDVTHMSYADYLRAKEAAAAAADSTYQALAAVTHISYADYLRAKKQAEAAAATPTSLPAPPPPITPTTTIIAPAPQPLLSTGGVIALVVAIAAAVAGVVYWRSM